MADNSDTIATNALGPKKAAGETGSFERFSVDEQIEADRYEKAQSAASKPLRGVRLARMIPPSSTGPDG